MAYIDDVPPVWNTWRLYQSARDSAADTRLLILGDSKCALNSSAANYMHGVCRTWNVGRWSFLCTRSAYVGSAYWLASGFSAASYSAARTGVNPGGTASGGDTLLSPNEFFDHPFSSEPPNGSATAFLQAYLNDLLNYASGDPWGGQQVSVRLPYYQKTGHVPSLRVRSYRYTGTDYTVAGANFSTINTTAITVDTGSGAWTYLDSDCGTGAGPPGVGIVENSQTENGTRFYSGTITWFKGTPGTRTTGFGLSSIATGGYTTQSLLRCLGGDGASRTCSEANVGIYLANTCFWPNFVMLDIGQNLWGSESTELAAGTQTTFRTNIAAILDQLNRIYDLNSQPRPFVVLCNHTSSGYTQTTMETKGRVLFDLARQYGYGFIDRIQTMPRDCTTVQAVTSATVSGAGPTYTITKVGAFSGYWPQIISLANNGGGVSTVGLARIESKTNDALTVRPLTCVFGAGGCNLTTIRPFTMDGTHYASPDTNGNSLTGHGAEWLAQSDWSAMAGESYGRQLASATRARVR